MALQFVEIEGTRIGSIILVDTDNHQYYHKAGNKWLFEKKIILEIKKYRIKLIQILEIFEF